RQAERRGLRTLRDDIGEPFGRGLTVTIIKLVINHVARAYRMTGVKRVIDACRPLPVIEYQSSGIRQRAYRYRKYRPTGDRRRRLSRSGTNKLTRTARVSSNRRRGSRTRPRCRIETVTYGTGLCALRCGKVLKQGCCRQPRTTIGLQNRATGLRWCRTDRGAGAELAIRPSLQRTEEKC